MNAQKISQMINLCCNNDDAAIKDAMVRLAAEGLLPKKLIPAELVQKSKFASKTAEELAESFNENPEFNIDDITGTGKNGSITCADIKKAIKKPATVPITPAAKKFAEENGLDLSKIVGTGDNGKILLDDIKKTVNPAKKFEITEKALNLANELKLTEEQLEKISGSGKNGKIGVNDVKSYAKTLEDDSSDEEEDSEEEEEEVEED